MSTLSCRPPCWPHSETIAVADTASKIDAASRRCVPTAGNCALKVEGHVALGVGRTWHSSEWLGSTAQRRTTNGNISITLSQPTWSRLYAYHQMTPVVPTINVLSNAHVLDTQTACITLHVYNESYIRSVAFYRATRYTSTVLADVILSVYLSVTRVLCAGLPWIWNFTSISISTDFMWISMDIHIHRHIRYIGYMYPLIFTKYTAVKAQLVS